MAEEAEHKVQPIFIKRINKIVGGHHGGAWKVAYADFVTAMMAFFLLLWLLATTTPEQRDGIAEYFTPTVGLKDSRGIGFEGGLTPNEKGTSRTSLAQPGLVAGQVPQGPIPKPPEEHEPKLEDAENSASSMVLPEGVKSERQEDTAKAKEKQAKDEKEQEAMKKVQEDIQRMLDENAELRQLRKNVIITNTPEGLKIDVIDDPEKPLFVSGTATMTDIGRKMFTSLSNVITRTRNQLAITGHLESAAYPAGAIYTGWELSADRANATRRFVTESLHDPRRVAKVVGMADRDLLLPKEPQSPRNRRISLTLLRGSQMVDPKDAPAARDLLSVPEVDARKIVHKKPAPVAAPKQQIEIPETRPGSIFRPKPPGQDAARSTGDADASSSGPGFTVPREVPPAPPPPPKPKEEEPPPAAPVALPETNPDSIFTIRKSAGPGFTVPKDVPPAPPETEKKDTDTLPPSTPVQLPETAPGSVFAPDASSGQGFKAPAE